MRFVACVKGVRDVIDRPLRKRISVDVVDVVIVVPVVALGVSVRKTDHRHLHFSSTESNF